MSDPRGEPNTTAATQPEQRRRDSVGIVENMFSPEVYASLATSFSINAGCVTIKFVSLRWDNSTEPAVQHAVVVARVTMPLEGAQSLVGGLQSFLSQHGLNQTPSPRPKTRATDVLAESSL